MVKHLAPYRTYVIRCWQEPCSQPSTCTYRFSLEVPASGERRGFTSLEELMNAIELALSQFQAISEKTLEDDSD